MSSYNKLEDAIGKCKKCESEACKRLWMVSAQTLNILRHNQKMLESLFLVQHSDNKVFNICLMIFMLFLVLSIILILIR